MVETFTVPADAVIGAVTVNCSMTPVPADVRPMSRAVAIDVVSVKLDARLPPPARGDVVLTEGLPVMADHAVAAMPRTS
jgi:hypothetical protein